MMTLRQVLAFVCAFSFPCDSHSAVPPPPPDYTTTAPFTPSGRPLAGLAVTLDPVAQRYPVQSRADDLLLMVAATLRHHLQDAGASVRLTRWDDRPSTHPSLGPEADEAQRRWHAVDSRANLIVRLAHTTATATAGTRVTARLHVPAESTDKWKTAAGDLMAMLDVDIYHDKPAEVVVMASGDAIPVLEVSPGNPADEGYAAWIGQTGRHRDVARGLYRGIEALQRHGLGRQAHLQGSVTRMVIEPQVAAGVSTPVAALARQLWPLSTPVASTTEAQWLLEQYKSRVLTDSTFLYLSVRVGRDEDGWVVSGAASQPRIRAVAALLLRAAGLIPVRDEVRLLPAERLGTKRFGVTMATMALTWDKPAEGDGVQTQLLLGDCVLLLDESEDGLYLLVQGHDGYTGWVRSEAIWRLDEPQFVKYLNTPRLVVTRDVRVDGILFPAGASLCPASPDTEGEARVRVPGPEQHHVALPRDAVRYPSTPRPGDLAASAALSRLTVPYVFGGRSGVGLDCSGLTNVAYASAGLVLPRDARQQILVGQLVATPGFHSALLAGDLLFFVDETGRVIHTAVSLGGSRFVHASPPEVQVNSFDPTDPLYSEGWTQAFALARRPLN